MTDVTRIQAIIDKACGCPSTLTEQEIFELGGVAASAHDELARIKGAALSVPEIEERAGLLNDELVQAAVRMGVAALVKLWRVADADRATLLDALREVEAARSHLYAECCDAVETSARHLRDLNDARDALRAKEAEIAIVRENHSSAARCAIDVTAERDEARAQLAQAQKEIERLNGGWNDALMQRDKLDAYFAQVRKDLGAIMGWTSSKPDKVPSVPGLEAQARTIKHLADQAKPEISNLWKMVSAAVGDGWKARMTTGYSMAMALCAEIADIKEKLAQAERDKAAMRDGLTEAWEKVAALTQYGFPGPLENREFLDRAEVLHVFAAVEWKRDHGALVPQEGEAQPAKEEEFRAGLPAALRVVWAKWEGSTHGVVLVFDGDRHRYMYPDKPWLSDKAWYRNDAHVFQDKYRPHKSTWSAVELKAAQKLGADDAKAGTARNLVSLIDALGIHLGDGVAKIHRTYLDAYEVAKKPGAEILAAHRDAKPGNS